jgi:hypothetical protein
MPRKVPGPLRRSARPTSSAADRPSRVLTQPPRRVIAMARSARSGFVAQVFPSPEASSGRAVVVASSTESVRVGLAPRRSAATAKSEAAKSLQRFVRQEYWNGLAAGDVVRVAGHTARGRHWRFRAHVTNTSNGATWVEVALVDGPPPSRRPVPEADGSTDEAGREGAGAPGVAGRVEKVRSFDPSLVTPRWRRKGRVATLLRPSAHGGGSVAAPVSEDQAAQPALF